MTSGSFEYKLMQNSGKKPAAIVKIRAMMVLHEMVMPMDLWTPPMSFFPQYCAMKIEPPEQIPNIIMFMTKKIWFPRPTATMEVSPNCPIMMVSSMFTREERKFCRIIGNAITKRVLRNFISLCSIFLPSMSNACKSLTIVRL